MTDNTRTNISLLVSAVLIIPIILGSLYLQGVFLPDYQFTPSDTLVMFTIILGFFCILFGFIYWFIGYWQDTKEGSDKMTGLLPKVWLVISQGTYFGFCHFTSTKNKWC